MPWNTWMNVSSLHVAKSGNRLWYLVVYQTKLIFLVSGLDEKREKCEGRKKTEKRGKRRWKR